MNKSKFTYAKCPYCGHEYKEWTLFGEKKLMEIACHGYEREARVICENNNCGKEFNVKVHISYYGSKIKE